MNESTKPEQSRHESPRPFSQVLLEIGDGSCHAEMSRELHQLLATMQDLAVSQSGGVKGEFVLRLRIAIDEVGQVIVKHEILRKDPKPTRRASVFFLNRKGNLTLDNPRQQKLPLREVPRDAEPPREAEVSTVAPRSV